MKKFFGTDGIRGRANVYPMTPEVALKLGKAIAIVLKREKKKNAKIVIGKDTRLSGYMFETALTSGLVSIGADVLLLGPMPTPAIAHLTRSFDACAGIVISASHNPAEDNGIKIFDSDGFKLDDRTEREIEALLESDAIPANGAQIGKAFRIDDAKGRYIEFVKSSIENQGLEGLKLVVDCANGAAYDIAKWVFKELGAEVIALNLSPDGLNINKNSGALHPEVISAAVKKFHADAGIALDGDADRLIVCDEKGNVLDGDRLMALFAFDLLSKGKLKGKKVVATVMSNYGFELALKKKGIRLLRTAVGDIPVIQEMRKSGAVLGGEQSGHIIFSEFSTAGDGIISALQLLRILKKSGKKLSDLSNVFSPVPQLLGNVKVREKIPFEKMHSVKAKISKAEKKLKGKGRLLVRYSGTENLARVMVEGKNKKQINALMHDILNEIKKEIGA
ncbi:MAG: phosphoglucosamine mutase [Candidatus Diapherotrites archaeon]